MSYADYIKKAFVKSYQKEVLFPSEIGVCVRRSYFMRTEQQVLIFATEQMETGIKFHEAIQSTFKNELNCETEVSLATEINGFIISGRADAICNNDLLEFKVVSFLPPQPKDYHLQQLALYYKALLDLGRKIENVYIYYIKRDSLEVKEFRVSEAQLREAFARAVEFINAYKYLLETGDIKKFKPAEPSLCKYCQFRNKCNLTLGEFV